jgi:hypothetical protein
VELFRLDGVPRPVRLRLLGLARVSPDPGCTPPQRLRPVAAEVTGAWADDRVFRDGHWQFETADAGWRSLHYIAGGHFYAIGNVVDVPGPETD